MALYQSKIKSQYGVDTMPQTAENVARQFNINRHDQDLFAQRSQQRTKKAQEQGFFDNEITLSLLIYLNKKPLLLALMSIHGLTLR